VTGATTYTVSFKKGTYNVTLPDGVTGSDATATYDTDLIFTPTATGKIITGVTAKIGEKSIDVTKNTDGSYTIAGKDITGDITIEVTLVDGTLSYIMRGEYGALAQDTKIVIIERTAKLDNQKLTLKIDDKTSKEFFWSDKYSGYVAIVDVNLTEAQLAARLSVIDGTASTIDYTGDVDNSAETDAADSGIINDILHGVTLYYTPDDKMRLELDVNGNKTVSADDIVWVLEEAVGLQHTGTTSNSSTENT
jgi:hypothetical protein